MSRPNQLVRWSIVLTLMLGALACGRFALRELLRVEGSALRTVREQLSVFKDFNAGDE